MNEYFPQPKSLQGGVKVQLNLSKYGTKEYLKNASKFAKKIGLSNSKSNVDKLDIDKCKNAPSNPSDLESKADNLNVDKLVPSC